MSLGKAFVEIGVDFNKMRTSLRKAKAEFVRKMQPLVKKGKEIGAKIGRSIGSALKAGIKGAAVAFTALAASASVAFREFIKADSASSQLAKNIKASGEAAGFTAEELEKMARALQDESVIDDKEIKKAMGIISTFTNITGDNFKTAIKMTMDMSAAMGQGMPEAAKAMAKAIGDPAKRIGELAESGIQVTDSQKEMIRWIQKTKGVVAAQNALFQIFRKNALDGNSDATDRLSDRWKQLKNTFNDVLALIGEGVGAFLNLGNSGEGLLGVVRALRTRLEELKKDGSLEFWGEVGRGVIEKMGKGLITLTFGFRALTTVIGSSVDILKNNLEAMALAVTGEFNKAFTKAAGSADEFFKLDEKLMDLADRQLQTRRKFTAMMTGNKRKQAQKDDVKHQKDLLKLSDIEKQKIFDNIQKSKDALATEEEKLKVLKEEAKVRSFATRRGLESAFEFAQKKVDVQAAKNIQARVDEAKGNIKQAKEDIKSAEKAAKAAGLVEGELKKQTSKMDEQVSQGKATNMLLKGIGQNIGVFA